MKLSKIKYWWEWGDRKDIIIVIIIVIFAIMIAIETVWIMLG